MSRFCGNCFNETLNEQNICTLCGFDGEANRNMAPHGLPAGSILNGRYIIGRILGQGGFGITYTARDHQTGQVVAVKEFFPDSMAIRTTVTEVTPFQGERGENFSYGKETFLQEAETMAKFIGNPNIVRVFSYFEENGTAYFVMEYVDGVSYLSYLKSRGGKISVSEALDIIYPVMDALSAVHEKNIIHRDVTPDNIYISRNGVVKLLDFGAARYSLGNASRSLDVILKHGFAPREQYKRRGRQGPYTDVYALAATLYYSITGIRPDDALERLDDDIVKKPSLLGVEISRQQEAVLMKAMAVDPEDRFQTMQQFRDAMLRAKPVAKPEKKAEKPKAPEKKKPAPVKKEKPIREKKEKPVRVKKEKPVPVKKEKPAPVKREKPPKPEKPKKKTGWLISAVAVLACIAAAVFLLRGKPEASLSGRPAETAAVPQTTVETVPAMIPLTEEELAYNGAVDLFYQGEYGKAAIAFGKLGDFRDARQISFRIWDAITEDQTIATGGYHTVAVKNDGTVYVAGKSYDNWCKTISPNGQCDVKKWKDIVAITAGDYHTVGLKKDGTVLATGLNEKGQCDVADWTDIVDIAAGENVTVGLKSDGTVVYAGSLPVGVQKWTDIVDIVCTGDNFCRGLKSDGTPVFSSAYGGSRKDVVAMAAAASSFSYLIADGSASMPNGKTVTDIDRIFAGGNVTVAIQKDGTVICQGTLLNDDDKPETLDNWDALKEKDIAAFDANTRHAVLLKTDGTASAYGDNLGGRCDVKKWKDIRVPNDRDTLLAKIKPQHIRQHSANITENILMPVAEETIGSKSEFLNLGITRGSIRSLTFLSTLRDAPANAVDVSAAGNGKVLAWTGIAADFGYDVYIAAEGGVTAPQNSAKLFAYMSYLETVEFNDAFDTSLVTDMSNLFSEDVELKNLDLRGFDTSNVTDMTRMFNSCKKIIALDLSSFRTSNVTSMSGMFRVCWALQELDVSNLDTSHVTSMNSMFQGCTGLQELDLTGFDTAKVTSMAALFSGCDKLLELDLSHFDTSSVTAMSSMFRDCSSLKTLDLSGFDTSNVTDMSCMFMNCYGLEKLDVSGFDTSKVAKMQFMFYQCRSLKKFNAQKFPVNVETAYTNYMFYKFAGTIPSWYYRKQ